MSIEYVKPNGTLVTVRDTPEIRAQAKDLGWKQKPGRKRKVADDDSGKDS